VAESPRVEFLNVVDDFTSGSHLVAPQIRLTQGSQDENVPGNKLAGKVKLIGCPSVLADV
jgi:hypothetical protein